MNNIMPNPAALPPFPRVDRPCPSWCALIEGHGWESIFDDERRGPGHFLVQRYHLQTVSRSVIGNDALQLDIMASETVSALRPTGAVYTDPDLYSREGAVEDPDAASATTAPVVSIGWPERASDFSADDARRLAVVVYADLRAAADVLDRIEGRA